MSFENIQLPSFLIQEMYRDVLISDGVSKAPAVTLNKVQINHLGTNGQNVVVLINEKEQAYLNDGDFELLIKILKGCKLSMGDIALINLHTNLVDHNMLEVQFAPATYLLFGVSSADISLPLNFPQYQVQRYNNVTYLSAPSIAEIANNETNKKLVWASLKQLFSL